MTRRTKERELFSATARRRTGVETVSTNGARWCPVREGRGERVGLLAGLELQGRLRHHLSLALQQDLHVLSPEALRAGCLDA